LAAARFATPVLWRHGVEKTGLDFHKVYLAITRSGNYTKFRVEPPGVQVDPANSKRFVNITVAYNSGSSHLAEPSLLIRER